MTENLFKGIALVIDDQIDDATSSIAKIRSELEASGVYVVGKKTLPTPEADLEHLRGAAFVLLDWDLIGENVGASEGQGVGVPQGLKESGQRDAIEFLVRLRAERYVPVFIFTHTNVEDVTATLSANPALYQPDKPSHILIKSKDDVGTAGVMNVLADWVKGVPSALALKRWEREYERAKNEMFTDFYESSAYWPAVLWRTFKQDDANPSDELAALIGRNLISRMTPFEIDMSPFMSDLDAAQKKDPEQYSKDLRRVLEGERFVKKTKLPPESLATGDVFKSGAKFFVNIRPDCDCVPRGGNDPELYLLEGCALGPAAVNKRYKPEYGLLVERDGEAIVFAMCDEKTVSFQFNELHIKKWSEMKGSRHGRLLPPFSTRIQQRYAAYLQRLGLPRIPSEAVPTLAATPVPPVTPVAPAATPEAANAAGVATDQECEDVEDVPANSPPKPGDPTPGAADK